MYKLFYAPESASMGVRVLLDEIGAPYELVPTRIAMDAPRPPELLAINPNGWVPVLSCEYVARHIFANMFRVRLCAGLPATP